MDQREQSAYRGFTPRPLMKDIRLFHGYMASVPKVDEGEFKALEQAFAEPFVGITTDGTVREGMYDAPAGPEGRELARAVAARARAFIESLDYEDQRHAASQSLDSAHRRRWTNAFTTWLPPALMLDDLRPEQRDAAIGIVRACMSETGFAEVRKVMALNEALGDFVRLHRDTLGEWIYWFTIFGSPSDTEPWGWQLMGHHLVLNCVIAGDEIAFGPTFLGAEITEIDRGPMAGMSALQSEHAAGPAFLHTLSDSQRDLAVLFASMRSEDLPPELAGRVDGRHRGGAGRDNLVLPYQGLRCDELEPGQASALIELIRTYVGRVAEPQADAQMELIERHLTDTHFAWIGNPSGEEAFYYRVHSPVILIEFDHHAGIFLTAEEPQPFHIHTIVRLPNGGDYGVELLRRHARQGPPAVIGAPTPTGARAGA
jgi:Protein of unknown function (DUF3500)